MARKELEETDSRFRENFIQRTLNSLLVGLLIALSYLPFWVLYRLSDVMYLFIRFIFKYRWKVITTNLRNAFPEKPASEINRIRSRFYRHFCDMFFESIKIYSISDKLIERRLLVKGTDAATDFFDKGRSVVALAMHHNNWEWTGFAQSKLKHHILNVYNPIRGNNAMENFLLHNRQKWGSTSIPVHKTARAIIEYQKKGVLTGLWLAADQTPPANSKFWTIFLNQETPFYQGPEKIAISTNQPVFFQHTKKTGRGKYEIEFILLFENPKDADPDEILMAYVKKTEEIIRSEPEYYLWSHRRWKHKRPEGIELKM
jgi:KDO2-lipid IV(A) lauroyltransferase